MKKPEVWKLVLRCLWPTKSDFSRDDWRSYIHRYLLPEIQAETLRFYGETTSTEALHPGLDYASARHRVRLGIFPRHKQLFGVFDKLRLTDDEILALCRWGGTLSAKEHFEHQHNLQIKDTTWEGISQHDKQTPSAYVLPIRLSQLRLKTGYDRGSDQGAAVEDKESTDLDEADEDGDVTEGRGGESSRGYGGQNRQRLMDGNMDAEWERWMREALERDDAPFMPEYSQSQALQNFTQVSNQTRAQMLRDVTSAAISYGSSLTLSQMDPQQPQGDSASHDLNDNGTIAQLSRPESLRPTRSADQIHQVPQRTGILLSEFQQSTHQLFRFSNDNTSSIDPSTIARQDLDGNDAPQISFMGLGATEISSDYSRSHITALQDSLSNPQRHTQFYPSARVVSAAASGPGRAVPSATPSTSVPS